MPLKVTVGHVIYIILKLEWTLVTYTLKTTNNRVVTIKIINY